MSLNLNPNEARQADRVNQSIRTAGKYVGKITRAEKLLSEKGTEGLGISFVTDDGATANYLDLYTVNSKGESLPSLATVQAILCCTRTKKADEGSITFDGYDKNSKSTVKKTANGYPALMGKRIGFLLQQEISDNIKDPSKPNDRVIIYGVFEADSELTASEILDQKTQPEKLEKMLQALMARPVIDRRLNKSQPASSQTSQSYDAMAGLEDDIPFDNPYKGRKSYLV